MRRTFKEREELASRARDELFSPDEQLLLRKVVGTRYIDIADQLVCEYGKYGLDLEDEDFLNQFAIIKMNEGEPYLHQLRLLRAEMENLMNPILFYSTMKNTGTSNTNMCSDNEGNSNSSSSTGNFAYEFLESSGSSSSASLTKGAVTQTSQQNKQGLEKKGRKNPLINISGQLVGKKEFDPNKILQKDKVLDVREAHYEMIEQEQDLSEIAEGDLYSTMNLALVGDKGVEYSASNKDNLSLSRSDTETSSKSGTTTVTDFTVDKTFTQYVANEATMRALRNKIPLIQKNFFSLFLKLFRAPFI